MNQLISIITPSFNSHQYIVETYHSLVAQTYTNWEWLVIDDGSTDNSPEQIKQLALSDHRIKFYARDSENKGASVCRNLGIKNSTGDYIVFLDADDLLAHYCLDQRIRYLLNNPELDFAVFNMGYFNQVAGDTEGVVNHYHSSKDGYLKAFISYNIPWQTSCPFWKSSFLKTDNICFSEEYQRLQDPEFHAKILLKYEPKFKVIKESPIDCYYRQGLTSKTPIKTQSFQNIVNGFTQYVSDIKFILASKNKTNYYETEIKKFVYQSMHTLLFMHRLKMNTNPMEYYRQLKHVSINTPIASLTIRFFYWLNLMRISFIKGVGISRLWFILTK